MPSNDASLMISLFSKNGLNPRIPNGVCNGCALTAFPTELECAIEGKSDALYVSYDDAPWTIASGDDDAAINNPHASVAAIGEWVFFLNIIFFFYYVCN